MVRDNKFLIGYILDNRDIPRYIPDHKAIHPKPAFYIATVNSIPYIANQLRWINFLAFTGRSATVKLYGEIVCAMGFGHTRLLSNRKCFPVNYNLVLQPPNFSTLKDLQYMVSITGFNYEG